MSRDSRRLGKSSVAPRPSVRRAEPEGFAATLKLKRRASLRLAADPSLGPSSHSMSKKEKVEQHTQEKMPEKIHTYSTIQLELLQPPRLAARCAAAASAPPAAAAYQAHCLLLTQWAARIATSDKPSHKFNLILLFAIFIFFFKYDYLFICCFSLLILTKKS